MLKCLHIKTNIQTSYEPPNKYKGCELLWHNQVTKENTHIVGWGNQRNLLQDFRAEIRKSQTDSCFYL